MIAKTGAASANWAPAVMSKRTRLWGARKQPPAAATKKSSREERLYKSRARARSASSSAAAISFQKIFRSEVVASRAIVANW